MEQQIQEYKSLLWSFGEKPERSMKRIHYNNESVNDNENVNVNDNDNDNGSVSINRMMYDNTIDNNNIGTNNTIVNKNAFNDNINNYTFDDNINTISSCMNTNMNTNMSMSISQMGEFRKANNKRESVNSKLDERYSIGNIGQNPFNRENNYMKDLENQQKFMIPKSSYDEKM
jgi:hypothetical protein